MGAMRRPPIRTATHETFNPINILRHYHACVKFLGEFLKAALGFSLAQILDGALKRILVSSLVVDAHVKPINDGPCLTAKALNHH